VNLEIYAPCPIHRLWHDVETPCFYCLVEKADGEELPELIAPLTKHCLVRN
jgi:hypothetical protein